MRHQALEAHPELRAALAGLAGKISDAEMQKMNYAVDSQHADMATVVRTFLHDKAID